MRQMTKEEQMQKNGGKKLRISCQGVLTENNKQSGCSVHYAAESSIKQVAEAQMGIHQTRYGHYP